MITAELIKACFEFNPITGEFCKGGEKHGTINKRLHSDYAVLSIKIHNKYKKVYAHRAAWMCVNGDIKDGMVIDHIDGNGLNNCIVNLRLVSKSVNQRNRKNKISQRDILGVYPHRGGFVIYFLGKYAGWTKDYFDACCIRKSLESKNGFIN